MFGCQFIFSCLFLVAVHVIWSLGDELSQKENDQIVSMHNKIRGEVSPTASPALPKLMIWAATTEIGCGVATCSQFTFSDGDDMSGFDGYKYLVGNYYQAGNMPGEPPYKTGKAEEKATGGGKTTDEGTPTGEWETTGEGKPTGGWETIGEGKPSGGETDIESFY